MDNQDPVVVTDDEYSSEEDQFIKPQEVESSLNREGDQLPFGYYNPETDGKLTWNCGYDQNNKIVSIFCADKGEKRCSQLKDLNEAIFVRDELIKAGWNKLIPPKIQLTMPDANGKQKPLNRKEKRYLERKIRQGKISKITS